MKPLHLLRNFYFQQIVFTCLITCVSSFESIEVNVPELAVQQKIGAILSTYDDLIENSQLRINALERALRNLFREWFIEGKPPAGFSEKSLRAGRFGDMCNLVKAPYREAINGELPLLDLSRFPKQSIAPIDSGLSSELKTSRILFNTGDTLFGAIRCYQHKVVISDYDGVTNTSVLVLRPKYKYFRTLLAIIASEEDTIRWAETHSTGTKMPVISWDVFQNMPVVMPVDTLAEKFESIASPFIEEIAIHSQKIRNLRKTLHILSPRLLSGQIIFEDSLS
jgi:type I restriction enzyme S subunit